MVPTDLIEWLLFNITLGVPDICNSFLPAGVCELTCMLPINTPINKEIPFIIDEFIWQMCKVNSEG